MRLLSLLIAVLGTFFAGQASTFTQSTDFTHDWRFNLGDVPEASSPDFNDNQWRTLNLPHDWAIEGNFGSENPAGAGGGALPGGVGWYRKDFTVKGKNRRVFLDFDGSYMNTTVWVNGKELGTRPYGYISFSYDITDYVKWGKNNVVAVRVDNSLQPNARWYSGCGIYRPVRLRTTPEVYIPLDGVAVLPTKVSAASADVNISVSVANRSGKNHEIKVTSEILDGSKVVETGSAVAAPGDSVVKHTIRLNSPKLWSLDSPNLYTVKTTLWVDGKQADEQAVTTGVRYFKFTAEKGFSLNGKPMKINGVCMHHDLGCLGAAVNKRAIERQLQIMKEMGCNSIRLSHNPPSRELLDLCDQMGLIVMDEAFDVWRKRKTEYDYALYFDQWYERDLNDFVVRDRNHPCIIMWSIGNEVLEQWTHVDADTLSLEQANIVLNFGHSKDKLAKESEMSVNSLLTRKMSNMVRDLDSTRIITSACNEPNPMNHVFRSGAVDLIGYNYHDDWIPSAPKNFPGMPFILSETVSALGTRGYYRMPSDSIYIAPKVWYIPYYNSTYSCSSYDNCHVPWGLTHEQSVRIVEDNDFVSGQYVWTGFDYLGEPTPYGFPARSSYFGIVDLAGFPKDVYYMYQSVWRPEITVLHLYPHWNWQPGQEIDLWAYYNNADEVELFVNGKSQGVRSKNGSKDYHVMWRVTYVPGEVKAVSRKNGKVVAERTIRTAGAPAAIRLTPDRNVITADGRDLSFVTVEIVDKDGNLCPNADNNVRFTVEGNGFIAGVDNGCQYSMERFKANHRKAFYGKCLVVIQNSGKGEIKVGAAADGLDSATTYITSK